MQVERSHQQIPRSSTCPASVTAPNDGRSDFDEALGQGLLNVFTKKVTAFETESMASTRSSE